MATVPTKKWITPAEYLQQEIASPEKHEYYRGEVFQMAGGSPNHNRITINLQSELYLRLKGKDCQVNNSDTRIKVSATGLYTYPDLSVSCKPVMREDDATETLLNPKIIVEVLSPSTEQYDRGTKVKHYRQIASVMEIVLVSQSEALIEHYVRKDDSAWTLITCSGLDTNLKLPSIACEVPLALIYANVEWPAVDEPEPLR